jgi:hypothetical protein
MGKVKTIEALNEYLNTFSYGSIYGDLPYDYYSIDPVTFEREKKGVCWDFVAFQADYFNKHFYNPYKIYYLESNDGMFCHAFMVYKTNLNRYTVFESCASIKGLHEFENMSKAIDYEIHKLVPCRGKSKARKLPYILYEYKVPEEYGLTADKYMEHIYHTGTLLRDYDRYSELIRGV